MGIVILFDQILSFSQKLTANSKRLVLVGGCFDILHSGHIHFLQKAKEQGDTLVVLLESDASIKKKKGPERPINTQLDRAKVLSSINYVDFVVLLPVDTINQDYANVTKLLKPAIIATTKGDTSRKYKEDCAALVGAEVIDVIEREEDASTTRLTKFV